MIALAPYWTVLPDPEDYSRCSCLSEPLLYLMRKSLRTRFFNRKEYSPLYKYHLRATCFERTRFLAGRLYFVARAESERS